MQLRGVHIGTYHTGRDWDLILSAKSLTPPEVKTNYIKVDGRDGDLDLSEALTGEVRYESRSAVFEFTMTEGSYLDREQLGTDILRIVHGRRHRIILDDDPDHYLEGRCTVTDFSNTAAYGSLTIEAICDPWRYSVLDTVRVVDVTPDKQELVCINTGGKTVVPEFQITGSVLIEFDTGSVSLDDGTYKVPEIKFKTGPNLLTLSGTGSIRITYKEALL